MHLRPIPALDLEAVSDGTDIAAGAVEHLRDVAIARNNAPIAVKKAPAILLRRITCALLPPRYRASASQRPEEPTYSADTRLLHEADSQVHVRHIMSGEVTEFVGAVRMVASIDRHRAVEARHMRRQVHQRQGDGGKRHTTYPLGGSLVLRRS